jgi:uncharacterized protein YqgC (DUF456 family)
MVILEIIALVVVVLISLIGIVMVPFGLPGTFVVAASAIIYNLITWSWTLSIKFIAILFGLAILAEILEWIVGAYSAKKFGASKWGIAGAIIGAIAGTIIGTPVPLIGNIIGMIVGAFLGAFVLEIFVKKDIAKALKAGYGAFLGRIGAILLKFIIAAVIFTILLVKLIV